MRFILILILMLLFSTVSPAQTSLATDARVGVILDRQGTALVRPAGKTRWTPLHPRTVLLPGDLVRTPTRGANAVEISIPGKGSIVLGPGGLIELPRKNTLRLHAGDIEVTGNITTTGPGGFSRTASSKPLLLRARDQQTLTLTTPPRWLTGYRASTTDEWMGSLIAQVDGRDVPLSVGFHRVTAEIRDQIARTTIVQSFKNATDSTLEGVFYFPLPADASISGFGMWINGELVEADIVEKQKARRIYEDILRRKKDPGLLEWSGGNLFKARVFPILPLSEKRIRIQYTQVLPLEGASIRYRYGLRSELLRSRPLRELSLTVIVFSAMPIKNVSSSTHEVRVSTTPHAASAEFTAQEYSPDQDFEVQIDLANPGPLTIIPHCRGNDGYFMVLLNPPAEGAGWQRDLLPESDPLNILLIADTSGSMDTAARTAQASFIQALLAQLGEKDSFSLLAADAEIEWFTGSAGATLAFLEKRPSLGWTDLDLAFKAALEKAGPGTILIYVGDGIGTTGNADPVALASRLGNLGRGKTVSCHAVSTSATFEKGVLEAIASIGNGSVRTAGNRPADAAFALLEETTAPALKNLQVTFEGIRTARVYPARLPNLPLGSQQVVLGRFLATPGDQAVRVIVTGTRNKKPVRFWRKIRIPQGLACNSFLPRLWARKHIDALLQEGASRTIRDEIVRFSETYNIMTPYTSFLVLESDADREYYGVKRRVRMRDGERFFAQGRDAASTALLREQMSAARTWRANLRKTMLREIATLGEHLIPGTPTLLEPETTILPPESGPVDDRADTAHRTPPAPGDIGVDYRGLGEDLLRRHRPEHDSWQFPDLPDATTPPPDLEPPPDWPPEVLAIIQSLDRRRKRAGSKCWLRLMQKTEQVHALTGCRQDLTWTRGIHGPGGWFLETGGRERNVTVNWLAAGKRGVMDRELHLGRMRDARPEDRAGWDFPLRDLSLTDLVRRYNQYTVTTQKRGSDIMLIIFHAPAPDKTEIHMMVDTVKGLVRGTTTRVRGETVSSMIFNDIVQVGGQWWATRVRVHDGQGRVTEKISLEVAEVEAEALTTALEGHETVIFLPAKDPEVETAKQAVHEEKAGFAEHFRVMTHFASSGQWDRAWAAWEKARGNEKGKPGLEWLKADLQRRSRRHEALKKTLADLARKHGLKRTLDLAAGIFQPNEKRELLALLAPGFKRPGEDREWRCLAYDRLRATLLGHNQEARAILLDIAARHPTDLKAVLDLVSVISPAEAVARLEEKIALPGTWLEHEIDQLYDRLTTLLREQRNLSVLGDRVDEWVARKPATETAYQRRLALFLFQDRMEAADIWTRVHLVEMKLAPPTTPDFRARLGAAIHHALGYGWNYNAYRLETRWLTPLATLARRLLKTDDPVWTLASRILGDRRFRNTDAFADLMKSLRQDLIAPGAVETLDLPRLSQLLTCLSWGRDQVEEKAFRNIMGRLRARWHKTTRKYEREQLAGHVLKLLDAHGDKQEAVAFLRTRLEVAHPSTRSAVAEMLLSRLLTFPGSTPLEDEIIQLVPALQQKTAAATVHRVAAGLYRMRYAHHLGKPAEYEKLTRTALRLHKRKARARTLEGLEKRFAAARDRADAHHRIWFEMERIGFKARLGRDLEAVDAETREVFSSVKADRVLRQRCAYVLAYCATRRKAPGRLANRTVAWLETLAKENGIWRDHLYRLLVALDRPARLLQVLETWIEPAKVERRWRLAAGRLLAETGRLEAAAAAFEAAARLDELATGDYRALADWYLVLGKKAEREHAQQMQYRVMPETQLYLLLRMKHRHQETLCMMRALLRKSWTAVNYISEVNHLYQDTKDFRVLACLVDGITGHTADGMYSFLEDVGKVLENLHEEATCDELTARIQRVARKARSALDRRGLTLLTALVERRAAALKNAAGPHAEKGLTALRIAFKETWGKGERVLMAKFLASLGKVTPRAFATEQLRQLRALLEQETENAAGRLAVARHLMATRWKHGRRDEAVDGLEAELARFREAHRGALPDPFRNGLNTLVQWLEERRRFARAEAVVEAELARQKTAVKQNRLRQRLFQVWVECLTQNGATRLGRGKALYRAARDRMAASLWKHGPAQIQETLYTFCRLHTAAGQCAGVREAGDDLRAFAGNTLPALLPPTHTDGNDLVTSVATSVKTLCGARAGLRVLLDRMENEPAWFRRLELGGWSRYGRPLCQWRAAAGDLGDLEPRLLRVVTAEIERDLTTLQQRNRSLYTRGSRHFWAAKKHHFAAVAGRVIEHNPDSPARLLHAAQYLWKGLKLRKRAAGVLLEAQRRGRVREDGRYTLVTWLFHLGRYPEALPVLEALLLKRPDKLRYRALKIRALHETGKDKQARALLGSTVHRLKALGKWSENTLARLAETARLCCFHGESVTLYEEVIPLHQRTHPDRGVGRSTLPDYYGKLARAYAALGKTDRAVDAASAAVVAWGQSSHSRSNALKTLRKVVEAIKDLDAYVAHLDAKAKKTGRDAPVIRKTIGLVYLHRKQPRRAAAQLTLARTLQPDDAGTHTALVRAYDAAGDKDGACRALLAAIAMTPMNLDLYPDLGRHLAATGRTGAAERAWTTLAEIKPNEAEGHRRLAKHRMAQKRHAAAVVQWQQVVRCRPEEPDGWFGLARARLRAGDVAGGRATLNHLLEARWEARFKNVKERAATLLRETCSGPIRGH